MRTRIKELAQLAAGWLDGEGRAPPADQLAWFENAWAQGALNCPEPYIYPTLAGGLSLEWDAASGITLELDLLTKQARALQGAVELDLNLAHLEGWAQLKALVLDGKKSLRAGAIKA